MAPKLSFKETYPKRFTQKVLLWTRGPSGRIFKFGWQLHRKTKTLTFNFWYEIRDNRSSGRNRWGWNPLLFERCPASTSKPTSIVLMSKCSFCGRVNHKPRFWDYAPRWSQYSPVFQIPTPQLLEKIEIWAITRGSIFQNVLNIVSCPKLYLFYIFVIVEVILAEVIGIFQNVDKICPVAFALAFGSQKNNIHTDTF